jgi:hemoglobin
MTTLFDQIGGDRLRRVLEDFYDRVLSDPMIGFLFVGVDRDRLVQREWEFTARLLGARVPYTGRSMPEAHAASPILGGHFLRRQQLLREVLAAHDVPAAVSEAWLAHNDTLRPQVTADRGSECSHERSDDRLARSRRRLPIRGDAHVAKEPPAASEGLIQLQRRKRD